MTQCKNRYCICVFWEKDGIVRDYVIYYLKGLQEIANKVLVAVNGKLTDESKEKLESLGVEIFQRENNGLDFGGWKDAIGKIGYDELLKYDELILTNTTCYGPIYPLSEMFDEMESRDCDFWGITKHPSAKYEIMPGYPIIEHIQSYFLVFNRNVISSKCFKNWWENVKYYNEYNKIVSYYEVQLTKYFENNGFKSDSFVNLSLHDKAIDNPLYYTHKILKKVRLPLIKCKALVMDYNVELSRGLTNKSTETLNFIKNNTCYNLDMIWENMIKTYPMSLIRANLHLNYVLPTDYEYKKVSEDKKIALILYIYYEDLVEYCFNYAKNMPEGTDIYLVSSKQSTLDVCKEKSYLLNHCNLIYRLKPNRGRDVSAYLVTCADVFEKYDLICCMHDKKTPHVVLSVGEDFATQCFECNLKNKVYVSNIINLFDSNKYLGLVTNPVQSFSLLLPLFKNPMCDNLDGVNQLTQKLNLTIPVDEYPIGPFGAMFWVRGEAIKPLFRHNWQYDDFPDEPLPPDGTISHAIERIYPMVAQEAGYISAWVMPNDFAQLYVDNLLYASKTSEPIFPSYKYKPIEKIFSIKNASDKKHKVLTISGIKIKYKRLPKKSKSNKNKK